MLSIVLFVLLAATYLVFICGGASNFVNSPICRLLDDNTGIAGEWWLDKLYASTPGLSDPLKNFLDPPCMYMIL